MIKPLKACKQKIKNMEETFHQLYFTFSGKVRILVSELGIFWQLLA